MNWKSLTATDVSVKSKGNGIFSVQVPCVATGKDGTVECVKIDVAITNGDTLTMHEITQAALSRARALIDQLLA